MRLFDTVRSARATLRRMKRAAPGMFPEYLALQQADREYRSARDRLKRAREAWRALGQEPKQ